MQLKIEMNLQMEAILQYNSSYNEGSGGIQDRFDLIVPPGKIANINGLHGNSASASLPMVVSSVEVIVRKGLIRIRKNKILH